MSKLFQEMLYSEYAKKGIFGNKDFWDSKRSGKYSGQYSELAKVSATELYGESKKAQMTHLNSLIAKNYSQQFDNATRFIQNIYRPLGKVEKDRAQLISGNDILKKINEFFNMPLKTGGNQGYSKITEAEELVAQEIEDLIIAIRGQIQGTKGSVKKALLSRLNYLLVQSQNFEDQSAEYGSKKGQEVEKIISEYLNSTSWAKNLQTGNIFRNGAQLGEDIMIMNKISDELNSLSKQINGSQVNININDSIYSALKAAESFSIQVKSGVNQSIFNKANIIYQVSLQELQENKYITLLRQLKEWDSGQSKIEGKRLTAGAKKKNLNKNKERESGYFLRWPKSETLRAIATYGLSKSNNILQSLYRLDEYQVYWVLPYGFITLPEYLRKTGYFWQFSKTVTGFDYTPNFMFSKRQITLNKL